MKKVIVLIIVFLCVGIIPSISASIGNYVKEDLPVSGKQYQSFSGEFIVVGFLNILHQSGDEITWECTLFALVFGKDVDNNFILLPVKKTEKLVTRDFVDGIITIIVFGHCSYFNIE